MRLDQRDQEVGMREGHVGDVVDIRIFELKAMSLAMKQVPRAKIAEILGLKVKSVEKLIAMSLRKINFKEVGQ